MVASSVTVHNYLFILVLMDGERGEGRNGRTDGSPVTVERGYTVNAGDTGLGREGEIVSSEGVTV